MAVQLDHNIFSNGKILGLTPGSLLLLLCSICYADRHETDGFIPYSALAIISAEAKAKPSDSKGLIEAQSWHEVNGGWQIHDYGKYQNSAEQIAARRLANRERQRNYRGKTKDQSQESHGVSHAVSNGVSNAVTDTLVTHSNATQHNSYINNSLDSNHHPGGSGGEREVVGAADLYSSNTKTCDMLEEGGGGGKEDDDDMSMLEKQTTQPGGAERFVSETLAAHPAWEVHLAAVRVPDRLRPGATVASFRAGVLRRWLAATPAPSLTVVPGGTPNPTPRTPQQERTANGEIAIKRYISTLTGRNAQSYG